MKNNLRYIREVVRGMSQEQLARIAGVSVKTIKEIEGGIRTPYVDTAIQIAKALHASVEDVFIVD